MNDPVDVVIPDPVWQVYLIECENGRLYTGISTDPARRFLQHLAGRGAMFTRINRPRRLLVSRAMPSRSDALKAEAGIKKLALSAKQALVARWCAEQAADR